MQSGKSAGMQSVEQAVAPAVELDSRCSRRTFMLASAQAGAVAVAGGAAAQIAPVAPEGPVNVASAVLDAAPPSVCARARSKSPNQRNFVKDTSTLVDLNGTNQGGQYWRYSTLITPTDDFFIRNEYPTPTADTDWRVDPRFWRLKVHGDGVSAPLVLRYNELVKLPSRTIVCNMECAGNGRSLFWEQQNMLEGANKVGGTGWGLGGVACAEWQYVPMSEILALVGLQKTAKSCLFWSGVDGPKLGMPSDTGRPIPVSLLRQYSNVIGLAFKMNGRDLTPDHGAPVRALVPGWCGAASTKWLTEIKISSHNFWTRLNSSAHVMIGPNYKPPLPEPGDEFRNVKPEDIRGQAVAWSPPRSLLTLPLKLEKQPKLPANYPLGSGVLPRLDSGPQSLLGYAWAPRYGIKAVHVRINRSAWQEVELLDPEFNTYSWRRFRVAWDASPGEHVIETRVTDRFGWQQPLSVPFNEGGFNYWAIPKFQVAVA
jgi:sulfane dehydrogenase subunit SoxC